MKAPQKEWSGKVSEKVFMAQVIQLARHCGWRIAHFRPAMTQRGRWVTPVQGDGAGFPDLVLVRSLKDPPRLIFAELKNATNKLTTDQINWIVNLEQIAHVETYVWRPSDFDEIVRILR